MYGNLENPSRWAHDIQASIQASSGPIGDVMGRTLDRDALPGIDRIIADIVEEPVGSEFMAPSAAPGRELKVGAHQELTMTQSPGLSVRRIIGLASRLR